MCGGEAVSAQKSSGFPPSLTELHIPLIVLPVNIILAMVYWLLGPHNTHIVCFDCDKQM